MIKYQTHLKLVINCLNIPITNWYKRKPKWTKKYLKLKEENKHNISSIYKRFIEEEKTFSINKMTGTIWMETVFPIYNSLLLRAEKDCYDLFISNKEFLAKSSDIFNYKPRDCKIVKMGNFKFYKPKC